MATGKEDVSFQRRLEQEIELWLKEGLIIPDQKSQILRCDIRKQRTAIREKIHSGPCPIRNGVVEVGS